jgi:7-cyano-7-deazaguanine synthase
VVRVLVQVQSIVIFRYYDDASADFGTGTSQPIEDFARNLSNLILRLRALVCRKGGKDPITDDPLENEVQEEDFRVYLVAHSMGGLVCRALALAWAKVLEASDIFIGVNALDYSGYPDCRPEYIRAYEQMANLATRAGVEGKQKLAIHTPLIQMTKAQIIEMGLALGVDFAMTSSCYDPSATGEPCGGCDSCLSRKKGFAQAARPAAQEGSTGTHDRH